MHVGTLPDEDLEAAKFHRFLVDFLNKGSVEQSRQQLLQQQPASSPQLLHLPRSRLELFQPDYLLDHYLQTERQAVAEEEQQLLSSAAADLMDWAASDATREQVTKQLHEEPAMDFEGMWNINTSTGIEEAMAGFALEAGCSPGILRAQPSASLPLAWTKAWCASHAVMVPVLRCSCGAGHRRLSALTTCGTTGKHGPQASVAQRHWHAGTMQCVRLQTQSEMLIAA